MNHIEHIKTLADSAKGRSAFYEYFSTVFLRPPGEGFIGAGAKVRDYFVEYGHETGNNLILDGVKELNEYIRVEAESDRSLILDMLNVQYTSMFLLGMNSIPTSESAALSPGHLIKQEQWEAVMAFYHIRKFKRPEEFREPDDHVSMELAFMRQMCLLIARLLEEGKEDKIEAVYREQRTFLEEHMLKWIPAFCREVAARGPADSLTLYKGVALILEGFLNEEKAMLDLFLND